MKKNFRYEGEYNSEFKQRISETVEYILDETKEKGKGITLSNKKLGNLLKYNIEDELEWKKYKSTMNRVKNILINYGIVLKSIVGIGYYVLKDNQISGYCYHTYIKRTTILLDKSEHIL